MTVQIVTGDCLEVLRGMAECSVDSIVTDPPYHLTTGKKGGSGPASVNLESPYGRARVTTGFMGMKWDGGDVAFDPDTWRLALRVLKPGGHLLAFGGSRTYHRLACAVEDAGFEIRDQIMWLYGSGFPKSHNGPWGGTALKPAHEPIVMARKPLIGTVEANVSAHGCGGLNIDGCRVGDEARTYDLTMVAGGFETTGGGRNVKSGEKTVVGRWPANVAHDGSDEVLKAFPDAPGQLREVGPEHGAKSSVNTFGDYGPRSSFAPRLDTGSAARFFYCAKASKADRGHGNTHPTVKPTELMRYLCRLVTPRGGTVLDMFAGSGSTGRACVAEGFDAILIELNPEYAAMARQRIQNDSPLFTEVA